VQKGGQNLFLSLHAMGHRPFEGIDYAYQHCSSNVHPCDVQPRKGQFIIFLQLEIFWLFRQNNL
jgi:hypothetical protein